MNSGKREDSLEMRIGMYWLHRLGIVSLVFGIVYLITSSFNSFLPIQKLLVGAAVSLGLLITGARMAGKKNQKWFANGLTAAGWSLAYFTTYAAHYIPSVKLVQSLPLETLLLSMVAIGSLCSSLRARSEVMSIYSIVLASVTILMNGPSLVSDVSFLIIAITTAVLANRESWKALFAAGLVACYAGHFGCSFAPAAAIYDRLAASVFLTGIWLAFSLGIGCSTRFAEHDRNYATGLACLNSLAFAGGLALVNHSGLETIHEWLFAISGFIYLGMAGWLRERKQEQLWTVHSLLGLFFINSAKVMHFAGLSLFIVDLMQIALLAYVGMKFQIKTFRWVAALLTVLFIPLWFADSRFNLNDTVFGVEGFAHARIGLIGFLTLAALAFVHFRERLAGKVQVALHGQAEDGVRSGGRDGVIYPQTSSSSYAYFYHAAALTLSSLLFTQIIDLSWRALPFALLAVANYCLALRRQDDWFVWSSVLMLAFSGAFIMFGAGAWHSLPIALTIVALYFGYASGRTVSKDCRSHSAEDLQTSLPHLANVLLTFFLFAKLPDEFVSVGLGLEGMVLLVAGFLLKERFFRVSALVVLALLTGKLLLFDMAHQNTFERILSFVAAGVVFLLSSYAYGKFTHSFDDDTDKEDLPDEKTAQSLVND